MIPASPKKKLLLGGATLFAFGGLLLFFMIGIPFIILGLALMIISVFAKEDGKMSCKSCGFNFISATAARLKDIQARLADEVQAVERLIEQAGSSPLKRRDCALMCMAVTGV